MNMVVLVVLVALAVAADLAAKVLKGDLVAAEVLAVAKVDVPNDLDAPSRSLDTIPMD